jgi:GGDEF domain-containing protein
MPAWRLESPVDERVAEHLGISWGAASFPVDAVEEDDLIGLADSRLYACKRGHYRSAAAGL